MSKCSKNTDVPPVVEKFLASCTNLPSLPSVVIKIIDASKDPDISLADIADILRVDPALSVKLLKIANSSMYAKRREITNLRDALSLLGLNAALSIALSFSLVKLLNSGAESAHNYNEFWRRSILSATIARLIGLKLNLPNLEDIFLAGLLQDIGILVVDCSTLKCRTNDCKSYHLNRIHCENNSFGIDHSDLGAWLLKSWSLPEKLYKAVLCSHTAYTKPIEVYEEEIFYQCVGLSGSLADVWFDKDREEVFERVFKSSQDVLGFDREEFNEFINDISNVLPEMSSLFEIHLIDENDREEILNEARNILLERNLNLIKQFDKHQSQIEALTEITRNIEEEAYRDHLTNVYNRKYIEKLLDEEFKKSTVDHVPLSLAFIDVDNFKPVNDIYGHLAGDKVLQKITRFFIKRIRKTDSLARYGGDEFLLMLPNTDSSVADNLLNRLIEELQTSPGTKFDGVFLKISISIGMATHMDNDKFDNLEDLINAADKALYSAKKAGKNMMMGYSYL